MYGVRVAFNGIIIIASSAKINQLVQKLKWRGHTRTVMEIHKPAFSPLETSSLNINLKLD
jgi:hypothetical protein